MTKLPLPQKPTPISKTVPALLSPLILGLILLGLGAAPATGAFLDGAYIWAVAGAIMGAPVVMMGAMLIGQAFK
jgi:hypothetical protein